MEFIQSNSMVLVSLIWVLLSLFLQQCCMAQSPAGELDNLLQQYAYKAFVHPHTGITYQAPVPSNLTGIKIAALRLRSGSLRKRGFHTYMEFNIPVGVIVQPYVERLVLVYQNLGNRSSFYYPLSNLTYLTPVLGLLAYDAANLLATDLPELNFVASGSPISINFTNVDPIPSGSVANCVWFDLDGVPQLMDLVSSNSCRTFRRGHFAIVYNSTGLVPVPTGPPAGHKKKSTSNMWKIIGGVVGGFVALLLLALLVSYIVRYRRNKKVAEMESRAEDGEQLNMARVGGTHAPLALGTRTQPVIENEYVAAGAS